MSVAADRYATTTPSVDVNIVTVVFRNSRDDVMSLLSVLMTAAAAEGLSAHAAIVINDESTWAVEDPRISVISGQGNVGFARGNALGVREIDSRHSLLVNPDCIVTEDAAAQFYRAMVRSPGIVIPVLEKSPGKIDTHIYESWVFTPTKKISHLVCKLVLQHGRGKTVPRLMKAPGTFVGMRTADAVLLDYPFDSSFYLYGEDRDMTFRARKGNVRIELARNARVLHPGGASAEGLHDMVDRAKADGMLRVAFRRYGKLGVALMSLNLIWEARLKDALRGTELTAARRWAVNRWRRSRSRAAPPITAGDLVSALARETN